MVEGGNRDIWTMDIARGVPGIETRLPLLFSEGVRSGRMDLTTFVALTATNPAKMYGLHPRKGTIAIGSDADIAIWDPDKTVTVTYDVLHDKSGYTPYEGRVVTGWPVTVLSRGRVVVQDGALQAERGRGIFIPCAHPQPAVPSVTTPRSSSTIVRGARARRTPMPDKGSTTSQASGAL